LYTIESSKRHAAATFLAGDQGSMAPPLGQSVFRVSSIFTQSSSSGSSTSISQTQANRSPGEEEEEEIPQLTTKFALALLLVVTVVTGFTAEFLVDSIHGSYFLVEKPFFLPTTFSQLYQD
jgi:Ca2+:H+ antiporter